MSTDTQQRTTTQLLVGGEWTDADGGRTYEDCDPFTGDVVADVAAGSREDARRAIEAAAAAFPAWSATPPAERQRNCSARPTMMPLGPRR